MALNLTVRVRGAGDAVVLLHGLFGSGSNLGATARALESDFAIYSVDLPNHGRSDWLAKPSVAGMAEGVADWIAQEKLERVHLLGHSLGGKVAMELARAIPSTVASLVVADIAPVAYPPGHASVFSALEAVANAQCASRAEAQKVMEAHLNEPDVIQLLLASLRRNDEGIYVWRLDYIGLRDAYAQLSAAPTVRFVSDIPALFIRGELSGYVKEKEVEAIAAYFPDANIVTMEGCGHWLHAQKPELFNRLVRDFFEKGDGRSAGT